MCSPPASMLLRRLVPMLVVALIAAGVGPASADQPASPPSTASSGDDPFTGRDSQAEIDAQNQAWMRQMAEHREEKAIEKWVYAGIVIFVLVVVRIVWGIIEAARNATRPRNGDE
jgi:hypothetical protein